MTGVGSAGISPEREQGERAPTVDQLSGKVCFVCGEPEPPEGKRIPVHHSGTGTAWACADEAGEAAKITGVPWWQSVPCPPWCSGSHSAGDHPLDRIHMSEWSGEVPLSLEAPDVLVNVDGVHYSVRFLTVYVQQRVREAEPMVVLHGAGKGELELTLMEANAIGRALLSAVGRAEERDLRAVAA